MISYEVAGASGLANREGSGLEVNKGQKLEY